MNDIYEIILSAINQPLWENWYIKEKIGSGKFGNVYRIEAERKNKTDLSALKIVPVLAEEKSYNIEERKNLVVDETEIMFGLRKSPNIVRYLEANERELYINGKLSGYYFLIRMELLKNVHKLIVNKRLDLSEKNVIKLALDIGNGIKAVHDKNIIHGDIKPENLFVSKDGVYKIGNLNISRRVHTKSPYIAPEIYNGAGHNRQTDICSFGICLYQMMNDCLLPFEDEFHGENAVYRRLNGEYLRPPKNASENFGRIILKACSFNPQQRYASIDDMLYDLECLNSSEPMPDLIYNENVTQYAEETPYYDNVSNPYYGTNSYSNENQFPPPNPYQNPYPTPYPATDYIVKEKNNTALILILLIVIILLFALTISAFIMFGKNYNKASETESGESRIAMYSETTEENYSESSHEPEIITETYEPEIITETEEGNYPPSFPYISATSELPSITNNDGTFSYNVSNVVDGDYSTCWAEGVSGDGVNESIFLSADQKQRVSEIIITNGIYKGSELFYKNNRVKDCRIEFSDGTYQDVTLIGDYSEQSNRIVFDTPVNTEYIKITILSVYYGNKYNDTCITEISIK